MRVTAETKEATRLRILSVSQSLFEKTGFDATTTRDIARLAGVATGTLFNYFPTKEAIAASLLMTALERVSCEPIEAANLGEGLFGYIASILRGLKPYRGYLGPLLETALSPMAESSAEGIAAKFRSDHLSRVLDLACQFGADAGLTASALQMYWSLYWGVLAFWVRDSSPKQEETLALLDQSICMFTQWLMGTADRNSQGAAKCRQPSRI